jgi:glycosyltransferase involved in cell wall biosynthesis
MADCNLMNKISAPLVSIIIPVYNGANFLASAIESCLNQTYKNIEIIVINDGSNDGGETENIAKIYSEQIIYLCKINGGVSSALNLGISTMKGKYFSWLSHDDYYTPEKISKQVGLLESLKDPYSICYSDFNIHYQESNSMQKVAMPEIKKDDFLMWVVTENKIHGCTLLIPKRCFQKFGVFDEELLATQDYDMWFRLANSSVNFYHQFETFVISRQHSKQTTFTISERVIVEGNLVRIKFFKSILESKKIISSPLLTAILFIRKRRFLVSIFLINYCINNKSSIFSKILYSCLRYVCLLILFFKQKYLFDIYSRNSNLNYE